MERIRAPPGAFLGWSRKSELEEVLEKYLAESGLKLSNPRVTRNKKLQRVEISRSFDLKTETFGYSVSYCRTFYGTGVKNLEEFWFEVPKRFRGSIQKYEDGLACRWCEIGNEHQNGREFLAYLGDQGFEVDGRGLDEGCYSIQGNTKTLVKAIVDYMVGKSEGGD